MSINKFVHSLFLTRSFHVTGACSAGRNWRLQQGLPPSGNEYGPLVDIPDWSYADGRPSPIQNGQKKRREQNKDFVSQAVSLMKEMKAGKEIHQRKTKAKEEAKQRHIAQKLRPKVHIKN